MSRHYQRAFDLLNSTAAKSAFDVKDEPLSSRERYGLNAHGQSVLQARRLVERGVPLVTVFWPLEARMVAAVDDSAEKPWAGLTSVRPFPSVRMMRQPPDVGAEGDREAAREDHPEFR